MAAGSENRALALDFSIGICCMFLILKCRQESDLGLCTTSVLHSYNEVAAVHWRIPINKRFCANFVKIRQCTTAFSLQVPKLSTDLDLILIYILIPGTYREIVSKNKMPALSVCFPQPCPSAGRMFAASRSRKCYCRRIVSFPQERIR